MWMSEHDPSTSGIHDSPHRGYGGRNMTEPTRLRQRVPCDIILGGEDAEVCACPTFDTDDGASCENVLSSLAAELTWKVLTEDTVPRQEMSKEAMVTVVRRLLA